MKDILVAKTTEIGLGKYASVYVDIEDDSGIVINVGFDEGAWSPSLYPEKYDGVILPTLFDYGYSASNYVYPSGNSKYKRSRLKRPGLHFIREAVDEFNATTPPEVVASVNQRASIYF